MKLQAINLLLDSARGQFIPRDFVQGFDLKKFIGITEWQIETLQNPDNEFYWDAWEDLTNNARLIDESKNEFWLYQDGDLWLICSEIMTTEDKINFGFEEREWI